MSKRLDTGTIGNELSGASRFFQRPPRAVAGAEAAVRDPAVPYQETRDNRRVTPEARPRGAAYTRTDVRRQLTRSPFEFYQDQLERLRELSLAAKLRGEPGSMSAMVREALDHYLAERKEESTG